METVICVLLFVYSSCSCHGGGSYFLVLTSSNTNLGGKGNAFLAFHSAAYDVLGGSVREAPEMIFIYFKLKLDNNRRQGVFLLAAPSLFKERH